MFFQLTDIANEFYEEETGDGIFVWTNSSTQSKISVLNRLFRLYDANPSDLVFYLRDESEKNR